MPKIIKEAMLECSKPNAFKTYIAKQGDTNSRFIRATLVDSGNIVEIDDNNTVVINVKRNDGEVKTFACEIENGKILAPIPNWALEQEGHIDCEIAVIDSEQQQKLSSTQFSLSVAKCIATAEDITQDENYDFLLKLITNVDTAVKSCENATDKATAVYNTVNEKLASGELKGADGAPGKDGRDGVNGKAATISVAGAYQVEPDEPIEVKNIGTPTAAEFLFSFPAHKLTDYEFEQLQKQLPIATSSNRGVIKVPYGCGISVDEDGVAKVNFPITGVQSLTDDITVTKHSGGAHSDYFDLTFNGGKYALKSELPTKTSSLVNDSGFISDSAYVHTDNNYTDEDRAKLAGLSNYDDTTVKKSIAAKQDKLTTAQLNAISAVSGKQDKLTETQLSNISAVPNKQDKLTVGSGLKLENNVLSLDIETATAQTTYGGDTQ